MPNPPTIATFRARTPHLLPDFDLPYIHPRVNGGSAISVLDLDDNISEIQAEGGFGALANASATVTSGGSPAQNDTITLQILPCSATIPVGKGLSLTIVVGAGPTTTTVATALAAAINTNPAFARIVKATSAAAVVTVTAVNPGLLGNAIAIVASKTGTGTITASAAQLSGGTGTLITPLEDVVTVVGRSTFALIAMQPRNVSQSIIDGLKTSMLFVV